MPFRPTESSVAETLSTAHNFTHQGGEQDCSACQLKKIPVAWSLPGQSEEGQGTSAAATKDSTATRGAIQEMPRIAVEQGDTSPALGGSSMCSESSTLSLSSPQVHVRTSSGTLLSQLRTHQRRSVDLLLSPSSKLSPGATRLIIGASRGDPAEVTSSPSCPIPPCPTCCSP